MNDSAGSSLVLRHCELCGEPGIPMSNPPRCEEHRDRSIDWWGGVRTYFETNSRELRKDPHYRFAYKSYAESLAEAPVATDLRALYEDSLRDEWEMTTQGWRSFSLPPEILMLFYLAAQAIYQGATYDTFLALIDKVSGKSTERVSLRNEGERVVPREVYEKMSIKVPTTPGEPLELIFERTYDFVIGGDPYGDAGEED